MTKALITQEVAIVIAVPSQNPSLLSEDFLKYSGMMKEWHSWFLKMASVWLSRRIE
jgi:hypothetical protein